MHTHKINLTKLKSAIKTLKGKSGEVECIIIPIAENRLYKGEKGVYLDLVGWEKKEIKEDKQTHLIKQSLPKEVLDKMSDEEKNAMPILGGTTDWTKINPETKSEALDGIGEIQDDLPF